MNDRPTKISVVVTVYNSGQLIKELVERLVYCHHEVSFPISEIILVDDDSALPTKKILSELEATYEKVRIIFLPQNIGQQKACYEGLIEAKEQIICTIDDDLEYLPEELVNLYQRLLQTDKDIIYGVRDSRRLLWWRRMAHQVFYIIANLKGYPRVSSMRCLKSDLLNKMDLAAFNKRSYPLLDQYLIDSAESIETVPVSILPRSSTRQSILNLLLHFSHFILNKHATKVRYRV